MQFRILGPLEVANGDGPIAFDAPKQRALLGVLLLHPNEVVSSERLIDELWGERPPATAGKVVQTYVSQLRRALGAETIATRPPGYRLRIEEGELDADRFRRLTAEGRRLAANGEQEQADAIYREALALWRGPPLANVAFESFARNEVERLEEERLGTLMDRIDCELALGRHDELVAELEMLVGRYPLRERLRVQLMLALYRSGRQAEALAAYRDARHALVEQLGLEPSGELQALERAILTHDAALEAPPRVGAERPSLRRVLGWRGVAVAFATLAGVVVALGLAFTLRSGEPAPSLLAPNSVGFIDAESGRVTKSFRVGREPTSLTVATDSLWVANYRDQTVTRIDRGSGRMATIPVGGHPTGITAYRDNVWVWTLEDLLVPIDPRFDSAGDPVLLAVGGRPRFVRTRDPGRIVAGAGFLWITAPGTTVVRVDPADTERRLSIVPDAGANGPIAYGEGEVWVAGSGFVVPITVKTGIPLSGSTVGGVVRDLAFDADSVWVVSGGPNRQEGVAPALRRVDSRTRLLQTTIAVGDRPVAVAAAAGSTWVASLEGSEGTIYRVDPVRNRVVATITVGSIPTAMIADEDGVWVAVT